MFNPSNRALLDVLWNVFILLAAPIAFIVLVYNGVSWMLSIAAIGVVYGFVTPSEFALFFLLLDRPSNTKPKSLIK